MRIARVLTEAGPRPVVADGDQWAVVEDPFAAVPTHTGVRIARREATLLAPVEPRVLLGMVHNGGPGDRELPAQAFLKSSRTVVGPGSEIHLDPSLGAVNAEGELALVVGRRTRDVSPEQAREHVLGWTIGNDVSQVGQSEADPRSTQVKNGDGFTPLGPWIETSLDALEVAITCSRNRSVVATASTSQLAWDPYEALSALSHFMTLDVGDVILTGAPGTFFPIAPGDECCIELTGLGALVNPVVRYPA